MDALLFGTNPWKPGRSTVEELLALMERPAWHSDAACREAPVTVTWFPGRTDNIRAAKRVCQGCLVVDECLMWALDQGDELDGVWGGLSRQERRRAHTR